MPLTLDAIYQKNVTIGVVGLGYVGLPLSLVFAKEQVRVIGFDIDKEKIALLEKGHSYIRHLEGAMLQEALKYGYFTATAAFQDIASCDAVIICVPTPLNSSLEPDLSYIEKTCETIAPYLREKTLISLESTTWPGTTEEVVKPLLEKLTGFKLEESLYLSFSPEREDPGNKEFNTKSIPKLVGALDKKSLQLAEALYLLAIDHVIAVKSAKVAECAKLFENIFRSVNIALVNELKMICEALKINVWEVLEAAQTKPFGFMSFWPGPGLGGHCIPIDPFYLTWKAKQVGVRTRFIELAGEINRGMPLFVVRKVQDCLNEREKALKGARILILGLSYKKDIDDMRESPSLELMHLLEEKGAHVHYCDPWILKIGKSRMYQRFEGRVSENPSKEYDLFLLATAHSQFSCEEILSYGVPIVDTRNFFREHELVTKA
jgi:UDP-N-acetyl-D-glucosamine dehydrogenase